MIDANSCSGVTTSCRDGGKGTSETWAGGQKGDNGCVFFFPNSSAEPQRRDRKGKHFANGGRHEYSSRVRYHGIGFLACLISSFHGGRPCTFPQKLLLCLIEFCERQLGKASRPRREMCDGPSCHCSYLVFLTFRTPAKIDTPALPLQCDCSFETIRSFCLFGLSSRAVFPDGRSPTRS